MIKSRPRGTNGGMTLWERVCPVAALCLALTACPRDEDDGGGGTIADASGDASGGDASAGDAGGGVGDVCDGADLVPSRDLTVADARSLSGVHVVDGGVVMLRTDVTFAQPTAIDTVALDGGEVTTLHASVDHRQVTSVVAQGDMIYFLERDNALPEPVNEVYALPVSGGAATRLGESQFARTRLVAIDGDAIYTVRDTLDPIGNTFERIARADGAVTILGSTPDGTPTQVHVRDGVLYFVSMHDAGGTLRAGVYQLPTDGTDATPTLLFEGGLDEPCALGLGGVFPTASKLACGFAGVVVRALDGGDPQTLLDPGIDRAPTHVLVQADDEVLYLLLQDEDVPQHLGRMRTDDATLAPVACDLDGVVANHLIDGFFPIQTEYEVVVGAQDIVWVEQRSNDVGTATFLLRAAAK